MSEQSTTKWTVEQLTIENLGKYPLGCIKNPKHIGYIGKKPWFEEMTEQGMITLILLDQDGKMQGFLELIPGENCWRGIHARDYMVVHCIWVVSKKLHSLGGGQALLDRAMTFAEKSNKQGIAVVTSNTSFIASKTLFEKNGYRQVDEKDNYELLLKNVVDNNDDAFAEKAVEIPVFTHQKIEGYDGLHMLHSDQCPMEIKWKADLSAYCKENNIELKVRELSTANEAQMNPSPLGTFALIYNNQLVSDHPVSLGRFKNIVKKELGLI